jgi:DNA-binding MarR family transcriptional regulator
VAAKPLSFDPIAEARRQWEAHWGEVPAPSMAAITSIMRVQQILMGALNELLRPFDLSFPRYELLMLLYLSKRGSLPLGKIGERLQVHRTSITGLVDRLESQGFVTRLPHDRDRRKTLAEITDQGRRVAEQATGVLNAASFGLPDMPAPALEQIVELLRAIRQSAGDFAEELVDTAELRAERAGRR